jgi:tRNA G18 (ribose-2'-O)-methylase SpoU
VTIPIRPGGAESLNVAAAAAIVCERISSPAMPEETPDA